MSNKTQLQTNNTALDGYIARINAAKEVAASLPEAGSGGSGGGSVETCRVGWDYTYSETISMYLLTYKENAFNVLCTYNHDSEYEDDVVKGSIAVIICDESFNFDLGDGCTLLGDYNPIYVLRIDEDCSFSFYPAWEPSLPGGGRD